MSTTVPPPARRMLTALLGQANQITDTRPGNDTAPVERASRHLLEALASHEAAFVRLDRLEDAIVIMHGHPCVPLPTDAAGARLA